MNEELKKYLLEQCRDWMAPEEIKALNRIGFTENGEEVTRRGELVEFKMEAMYGFADDKTSELVAMGRKRMEIEIAMRLLNRSIDEVINNCPKCGRLARTPRAKQCRQCGYDWHKI
jgi:ribosomal protein L40E